MSVLRFPYGVQDPTERMVGLLPELVSVSVQTQEVQQVDILALYIGAQCSYYSPARLCLPASNA
jgi:hypothetical protein